MPTIIKPTVGRKVWCFLSMAHYQDYQRGEHMAQPHDGTVIFVHDDRCINVRVMGHNGDHDIARGLPLVQEGDEEPNGAHARWMPYQTKQQAKADSVGTTGETQAASTETDALPVSLTGDPESTQEPSTETGQQTQVSDPSANSGGDLGSPL